MKESDFRKNFPRGAAVPNALTKLLKFQNRDGQFYSGHFELTGNGPATAVASFDGDKVAASQFILFGQEADGSGFGFWLHGGRKLADAPVVYLGSEGTGWTVLANSLEEFLALLAIGVDDLGSKAEWSSFAETEEPAPRLPEFRDWLKSELGILPAADAAEIVDRARKSHPDLQEWLAAWQQSHFGS